MRTLAEDWALAYRVAANQGQAFAVVADAQNEMLAASLRASLARYGFTQVDLQPEVTERPSQNPVADHRIRYGPDATDATRQAAQTMAARLAYFDYRLPTAIDVQAMAAANVVPDNTILVRLAGDATADPTLSVQGLYSGGKAARELSAAERQLFGDPARLIAAINGTLNWGFHEMPGNLWEWTADCWHSSYDNAPVDGGPWGEENGGDCSRRVVRGGGWNDRPRDLRSANRGRDTSDEASVGLGFRLARAL